MNMTQNELNGKTISFTYEKKPLDLRNRCIVVGAMNSGQRVWGHRDRLTGNVANDEATKSYVTGFDMNDEGQFKTFDLSKMREVHFDDRYWMGNR